MSLSRRETQRLERRAQIVAVARRHFFENGFDGTSMSAVAAELGGSKGTLWNYFPSKQDLFAAVIDDTAAAIRGGLDLSGVGGSPRELLTALCRSIIERMVSPLVVRMFRLVGPTAERHPELGRIFFERGPQRTQALIAEFLQEHFAGELRTDDYVDAGRDLVALAAANLHFGNIWGITGTPSPQVKEERAKRAAELFIRAYAKDPERLLTMGS
jgi:TetR/AcrR family transcriptional repressor of mexJK operon